MLGSRNTLHNFYKHRKFLDQKVKRIILQQSEGIHSIAAFHNCSHETIMMFHELTCNKQTNKLSYSIFSSKIKYIYDKNLTYVHIIIIQQCMQWRGIGPHLVARGKSHGFSRVAAGTWGIFSSCDGYAHSKRELFSEVSTLV